MTTPLPPIYRDCRRLLVHTEQMVMRFARYHKYTVGTDLRQRAMHVMQGVNKAVHDKPRQGEHVQAVAHPASLSGGAPSGAVGHGPAGSRVQP